MGVGSSQAQSTEKSVHRLIGLSTSNIIGTPRVGKFWMGEAGGLCWKRPLGLPACRVPIESGEESGM